MTPAFEARVARVTQSTCAEYAESDRSWATIDVVLRIAKTVGAMPSQVALAGATTELTMDGNRAPLGNARRRRRPP